MRFLQRVQYAGLSRQKASRFIAKKRWIPVYQACGFKVTPCWGMDEAVAAITEYLVANQT